MNKIHKTFESSPLAWAYYFFPHLFRSESPPFHVHILNAIINNKKVAIAAPRGAAKTTLMNFAFIAHQICFQKKRNIIIIQANEDKAMKSLANIKSEFDHNQELKSTYSIRFDKDNAAQTVFLHPDGFATQVSCYGRKQMSKVRGEIFRGYRPDIILLDDLEDDDMVRTRDLREELHRVYEDAIEPAIDTMEDYRIVYIDTIKHYDSQLAKLLNPDMYTEYVKIKFQARNSVNGTYQSLWPEKWSLEFLADLEKNSPIKFAKEMQNDPIAGSSQIFNPNDFRRWAIAVDDYLLYDYDGSIISKGSLKECRCAIGYDLAWSEKRRHDSTAIVPVLITPDNYILVDSYINEQGIKPDKLAQYMFSLNDKYYGITGRHVVHGMEKGKYEQVSKWFLQQEMKKRNKWLDIRDMQWTHDKQERITAPLQPRYVNHAIYHRKDMGDLETQLSRFPSAVHDDLPDALQNAVRLLTDVPKKVENKPVSDDQKFLKLRDYLTNKSAKKPVFRRNKELIKAKRSIIV